MICDRVAILVQGRVASQGTIDSLTTHRQRYEIEVASDDSNVDTALRGALSSWLRPDANGALDGQLPTGESIDVRLDQPHAPAMVKVATADAAKVQPLLDSIRAARLTLRAVRPIRPSLEDLFMEAVTDPETGKTLAPGAKEGA